MTLGATNVADLEDNIHLHDHDLLNERGRGSTSPLKHLEQVQQFSDCEVRDRGDDNKIEVSLFGRGDKETPLRSRKWLDSEQLDTLLKVTPLHLKKMHFA